MHLSITIDIVSTKFYVKRDNFDFEIVNFPFYNMISHTLYPMQLIFLNSSDFLEHLVMQLTSTLAINFKLRNFLDKAFRIIIFPNHFLSPIL